jgi:hypothetical protein
LRRLAWMQYFGAHYQTRSIHEPTEIFGGRDLSARNAPLPDNPPSNGGII